MNEVVFDWVDDEHRFLSEQGIKDREWYKHKGTAPGKWLGYGATTVCVMERFLISIRWFY
jgi:hypothetical protein